jgi:hypothetical protein
MVSVSRIVFERWVLRRSLPRPARRGKIHTLNGSLAQWGRRLAAPAQVEVCVPAESRPEEFHRPAPRASRRKRRQEKRLCRAPCDRVAGSGLRFEDRGLHSLRGLPEQVPPLYRYGWPTKGRPGAAGRTSARGRHKPFGKPATSDASGRVAALPVVPHRVRSWR